MPDRHAAMAMPVLRQPLPRLAVFRALQLGDMLCAVPALRALRAALPHTEIALIGLPWAKAFAERFAGYIDAFIPFPGYPGLPEQPVDAAAFARFLSEARERSFDFALQLHGDGSITNGIVRLMGARSMGGFRPPGSEANEGFVPYPRRGPEIRRLLNAVQALGARARGETLEFPLSASDEAELACFAGNRGLPRGPCICLHPGARAPEKRWPPHAFAEIGDRLYSRYRLPIVITGSEAERPLAIAVARAMRAPAADAAGPISVGALAAQIRRAQLLVTNDTGVSHIAAALRIPSVIIFRASDMERWAPLEAGLHRAVWDPQAESAQDVLRFGQELLDARARARAALLPAP